ncbi:MAG: hypothetical protein PHP28_03885 [Actinomycetota bacterium]|nr:hypothetical protein [Actinomycetota bacterium]MDD5668029.1 hypothetical protein [Actinomycetota bacterium]
MNRISQWYSGLRRGTKIAIAGLGIVVALAVIAVVAYMLVVPKKVEVRYGTIVRDPLDNHIWEDNTQTAWVDPSEAADYKIEYVDKYSPEHEEQLKKEAEAIAEQQRAIDESSGIEAIQTSIPTDTIVDLNTLQQNISVMGQDLISGMEMANEISEWKAILVDYRNQVVSMYLAPELETLRQKALQILDMYIGACDLYLRAISTADFSYIDEANLLIQQASEMIQSLMPS